MLGDGLSVYKKIGQEKAQRAHDAELFLFSEIQRMDDNKFSGATDFDVEKFLENMIFAANDVMFVADPRVDCVDPVTSIAEVTSKGLLHGVDAWFPANVPLHRKPIPDSCVMESVCDTIMTGAGMRSFPVLRLQIQAENRPVTSDSTTKVLDAVVKAGYTLIDGEHSVEAYCVDTGIKFATTKPDQTRSRMSYAAVTGKRYFKLYSTFDELEDYRRSGFCVSGFVFTPYRFQSQSSASAIERKEKSYELEYEINYKKYRSKYPLKTPKGWSSLYLDAWLSMLGLKAKDVHPKLFCYDLVTPECWRIKVRGQEYLSRQSRPAEIIRPLVVRSMMYFSNDFVDAKVISIDGYRQYPPLECDTLASIETLKVNDSIELTDHTVSGTIYGMKEYSDLIELKLLSRSTKVAVCKDPEGKIHEVRLSGYHPIDVRYLWGDSVYYEIRPCKPALVASMGEDELARRCYFRLSIPVFQGLSNWTFSYVRDIGVLPVTQVRRVMGRYDKDFSPCVRSYLLDYGNDYKSMDMEMSPDAEIMTLDGLSDGEDGFVVTEWGLSGHVS